MRPLMARLGREGGVGLGRGVTVRAQRSSLAGAAAATSCSSPARPWGGSWLSPPPHPRHLARSLPVPMGRMATGGGCHTGGCAPPQDPAARAGWELWLRPPRARGSGSPPAPPWSPEARPRRPSWGGVAQGGAPGPTPSPAAPAPSACCCCCSAACCCCCCRLRVCMACSTQPTVPSPPITSTRSPRSAEKKRRAASGPSRGSSHTCSGCRSCSSCCSMVAPICGPDFKFTNTSSGRWLNPRRDGSAT
ncbi:hypothetical protein V8C86DRAFT_2450014 [Haematococcus lacustris]